jgi:hypothetical protein
MMRDPKSPLRGLKLLKNVPSDSTNEVKFVRDRVNQRWNSRFMNFPNALLIP